MSWPGSGRSLTAGTAATASCWRWPIPGPSTARGNTTSTCTLVAGELKIGGRPFDGGKIRTGRVNLECDDGTIIKGRFTARRSALELRDFEQDEYPADVAALIANPIPPAFPEEASEP